MIRNKKIENMAARANIRLYILFLFIFITCFNLLIVSARMGKKLYPPMKDDLPFIKCDVCQKAVKYLFRKANSMREDASAKIGEEKLQDLVDKACNPEKFEGEWLAKLDIEEKNGKLQLTEHSDLGSCKAECRTVSKACEDTVGEAVDLDIAEELWKNELTLSQLINQVCYSDTKACSKKKATFKSGSRKDEKFQVMSEDEKKAQEYMKKAGDIPGMPNMQMYSREEMMQEMAEQESMQSDDEPSENSDQTQYPGGELSIWETIVQIFKNAWNWIQSLLGIKSKASEEL